MGVDYDKLADLIATTLSDYGHDAFEVMWTNQHYEYCERLANSKHRIEGGTTIIRNVMLDHTGQARYVLLFETEDTTIGDVQEQIEVPWAMFRTKYAWDVQELQRQKGSQHGFIDLLLSRRTDALWALADKLEAAGWQGRLNASDKRNPYGIPETLCLLEDGVTTAGFSARTIRYRDGSEGTSFQGLDAGTEAKWRNYAFVYTAMDNAFLESLTKACLMTQFRPPSFVPQPGQDNIGTRRMYAGVNNVTKLIRLANAQDDNNQPKDLAGRLSVSAVGTVMFNGMPIIYIPALDTATFSPVYAVDWDKEQAIIQDGYYMDEEAPMRAPHQPSVLQVYVNGAHQNLCTNRRTVGFVGHTVTS